MSLSIFILFYLHWNIHKFCYGARKHYTFNRYWSIYNHTLYSQYINIHYSFTHMKIFKLSQSIECRSNCLTLNRNESQKCFQFRIFARLHSMVVRNENTTLSKPHTARRAQWIKSNWKSFEMSAIKIRSERIISFLSIAHKWKRWKILESGKMVHHRQTVLQFTVTVDFGAGRAWAIRARTLAHRPTYHIWRETDLW